MFLNIEWIPVSMKGTVFKYGAQGDQLLRPEDGGKIVILTKYPKRPKIGSTVEYEISRQSGSVNYGNLVQTQPQKLAQKEDKLLKLLKILWREF